MIWHQQQISLDPRPRGFHLVTREILGAMPELVGIEVGILHLLIQHTSASLTLNENASPDVRRDFESWFNQVVPEHASYWTHTLEGPDDMPAHIKAALLGPSLTIPPRRLLPRLPDLADHPMPPHHNGTLLDRGHGSGRLGLWTSPTGEPRGGWRTRSSPRARPPISHHRPGRSRLLAREELRIRPVDRLHQDAL